ncbi:MAG: carboxypeptidase-like regulatory domain-containing protein [Bacteroidetes bacterium]|nr:carboxypeptidase-like regulatory domain-containing protein [Bacteroidota bacterium]
MKSKFLFAIILFIHLYGYAQTVSSISGKVIDAKTKESLPGAAVYLAQTTIGVSANEDGTFTLTNIPQGKYDLTVSMLGYQSYSHAINFTGTPINNFTVQLNQNIALLDSVVVKARKLKNNNFGYTMFQKLFLGQTKNAARCKILNRKDIVAYKEDNKLFVYADKPIEVENRALGYKVFYELKEFVVDFQLNTQLFSGVPRFEELTPQSAKQKIKWSKERDRAYYGSVRHFLQAAKHNSLKQSSFIVQDENGRVLSDGENFSNGALSYNGLLRVRFTKERPEIISTDGITLRPNSSTLPSNQLSLIKLTGKPIKIYDNGYYEDFHDILFGGYFGITEGVICELLPLGYVPSKPLK